MSARPIDMSLEQIAALASRGTITLTTDDGARLKIERGSSAAEIARLLDEQPDRTGDRGAA